MVSRGARPGSGVFPHDSGRAALRHLRADNHNNTLGNILILQHEIRFPLAGRFHRLPKPTDLTIRLQNFPDTKLTYRLYDLCEKCVQRQGSLHRELELDIGRTPADFFVLVTP
jgi:hypothetical protein